MKNILFATSLVLLAASSALANDLSPVDDYKTAPVEFTNEFSDYAGVVDDFGSSEIEAPVNLVIEGLERVDTRLPRVIDVRFENPSESFVRNVIILNLDQYNPTGTRTVTVKPTVSYKVSSRPEKPSVSVKQSNIGINVSVKTSK